MYKVLHFIKRKPHMTHAQFRDHFERSHAAMALKFCGHLFSEYRRNYVDLAWFGGDSRVEGSGYREQDWEKIQELVRVQNLEGIDRLYGALFGRVPWLLRVSRMTAWNSSLRAGSIRYSMVVSTGPSCPWMPGGMSGAFQACDGVRS